MADFDPLMTQRDVLPDVAAELTAAGFTDPLLIGRGGFGAVYRCGQLKLDRTVAVKILTDHLDDQSLERFLREQRAMGRLSGHPNIVNILEVGATTSGMPFIVMPYHPHDSLDARIRKQGPLDWPDVLRLGVKMAGALETAHRSGTLHRDIKPGNILLTEYGEPQLTDFGIARIVNGFETGADMVTGSPAFTAPELLTGDAPTVSSDVYGLGATLFCALTGHAAFERRSGEQVVAQFLRIAAEPVPDLRSAGVPEEVSHAVEHAMAREPEDRPTTAAGYGEELRDIQRRLGQPVTEMALPAQATQDPLTGGPPRRHADSTTAPPTPATKFRPPLRRRTQVPRSRLLEVLRAGERRRLILIHGPAGYGKTTVAAQWAERLHEEGVQVGWLTLDDDDNRLSWFLTHLVEAIRRVNPDVTADLDEPLEDHRTNGDQCLLTALINAIHEHGERIVIVVDDWHRVTDADAIASMDFLLEHGCHHLQLVITSRSRTGLPVSRMRVHDELVEIDIAGLCFDDDEARSFLVDVAGLDLENSDITDLRNSTDGWVAALQLACLSLRSADSPSELISNISGRHRAIGDFLAENVLGALQPDILYFLLTTSVADEICAGLATALSGEPRGQALLEDIEMRDLFLRRIDPDGDWFRFHPLFLEFLRRRLERDRPELVLPLHNSASEWYSEHGMLAEAVDHALAAQDSGRAVELVEADGRTLLEHSQMTTLLGLVEKLPPSAVAARPRLQLAVAWSNVLLHHTDRARGAIGRVNTALQREPADAPDVAGMRIEADVALACTDATADRVDRIDALVEECLAHPDSLPPFVVSSAADVSTMSATMRFDFDEAHRRQQWALPYHEQNTGAYAVMYGYALDGLAYIEELELDKAEHCLRSAVHVSRRNSAGGSQAYRLAAGLLAQLLYQRGAADEASGLLEDSLTLAPDEGITDMIRARYVTGARLAVQRGDLERAGELLDAAADVADRIAARRLRAFVEVEMIALGVPTRRTLHPRVDYAHRVEPTAGFAEIIAQAEEEAAIRLLLRDPGSVELACHWAREWVDHLADSHRRRALLQARRLKALCLAAAGRSEDAQDQMALVLEACDEAGMVRFAIDGGAGVASVAAAARSIGGGHF
ncbi:protein kinase [Gordonia sp. CPCC 205515]|uniref:protein kinase domain-containing protein n=1 Tax=Gordonia sp. CPCC 205515 TaxID=3140791 RepID=UPI003AF3AC2C